MKTSKYFLTTLFAAAAMSVSAYAEGTSILDDAVISINSFDVESIANGTDGFTVTNLSGSATGFYTSVEGSQVSITGDGLCSNTDRKVWTTVMTIDAGVFKTNFEGLLADSVTNEGVSRIGVGVKEGYLSGTWIGGYRTDGALGYINQGVVENADGTITLALVPESPS